MGGEPGEHRRVFDAGLAPEVHDRELAGAQQPGKRLRAHTQPSLRFVEGISCGGAGISRGRSGWRASGRVRGRRRLGGGGIPGGSPLKSRTCDARQPRAAPTYVVWAETGTTETT
jgi:hypothetical protein